MSKPIQEVWGSFLEEVTLDGGSAKRAGRKGGGRKCVRAKDKKGHDAWDVAI